MTKITVKRGDSFAIFCQRLDSAGNPMDLTGVTISSQVRYQSFSDTLDVTVSDAVNGKFTLSRAPSGTETWPVNGASNRSLLYFDVQFDDGSYVISSDTIQINIILDATQVTSASTGVPAASGNPLIFKDRAQPSGQASAGLTLEAALMYQGPTGPAGPQGPMGDVTQAALDAEAATAASSRQAATYATDAATSAQNAAASAGITQDTTFGANEGEIATIVGQMWKELSNLATDVPTTENALFQALSALGQIAKQVNGGRVTLAGGTLADPAIKIGTVGIYSAAADTLSIAIAGVEIFRITAAGIAVHGTSTTF